MNLKVLNFEKPSKGGIMGRKLQTIYEYFSDYTEKQIDDMIYGLSIDEKLIIRSRFGNDLHNPSPQKNWSKENSEK